MDNLIYIPIAIGVCCGAFLAYWTTKPVVLRFTASSDSHHLAQWGSLVGALAMAVPAFVFGMIGGGTLAGVFLELAGSNDVVQHLVTPLGLAVGIAVVLGGGLAVGIVMGALLGSYLARVVRKPASGDHSN